VGRFLVRPGAITGDRVRFDAGEARHLGRVLRLRPGARIEATDGAGRVFLVELVALTPAAAAGRIVEEAAPAAAPRCAITLAQGILRGPRMAWLIEKATELGVARIVPVTAERAVARPGGARGDEPRARWERIARAALKQCGRAVAPMVEAPRPLADLLGETPRPETIWLCQPGGAVPAEPGALPPARLLILVGPEGGFSGSEVAAARAAGAHPVGLGPRTLRGESAGLTALVLAQHLFGDLGALPPGNTEAPVS
jgi:16S rRNA (uracil1498-N3)-methyltransferase